MVARRLVAAILVTILMVGLLSAPAVAQGWEYDPTWDWQYYDATGNIVDHPYAVDSCRVLDVPDESFHAGSPYWFPVEGDGMERVYSYGCWL